MLDQAHACQVKAAECERAAVLASDEKLRQIYRDLAMQWREMARQAEVLAGGRGRRRNVERLFGPEK
jgi:muconolactone delta-isomerase